MVAAEVEGRNSRTAASRDPGATVPLARPLWSSTNRASPLSPERGLTSMARRPDCSARSSSPNTARLCWSAGTYSRQQSMRPPQIMSVTAASLLARSKLWQRERWL